MDYRTANEIYKLIESSRSIGLKKDLLKAAVKYARIRTDWSLSDLDDKTIRDNQRKVSHDAVIDSCNILSRNQAQIGEDNSWRELLGNDRKVIGDFACFLHCILGLSAR